MRYLLLVLVGCSGSGSSHGGADAPNGPVAAACENGQHGHGSGLFRMCSDIPSGTLTLSGTIDTTTDPRCMLTPQSAGPTVCLVASAAVEIGDVRAVGANPLVVVASTISVTGTLDASSTHADPQRGAGANACTGAPGMTMGSFGGGGAGGSFGGAGGNGGTGLGALGGTAGAVAMLTDVRGGCGGGDGGGALPGTGGASGGAVVLIADRAIAVPGAIFASGAGGSPTGSLGLQQYGGAGGGGAGGLIAFDAPTITVVGTIAANGGGGGTGGNNVFGDDGTTTAYTMPAAGAPQSGVNGHCGQGPGGDGGAMTTTATPGGDDQACSGGGGAGGGSVGIVWVRGALTGSQISPPPSLF